MGVVRAMEGDDVSVSEKQSSRPQVEHMCNPEVIHMIYVYYIYIYILYVHTYVYIYIYMCLYNSVYGSYI